MSVSDYDYQRIMDRLEKMDKRFGNIVAYVRRLEQRVDELERELGLQGDEEGEEGDTYA